MSSSSSKRVRFDEGGTASAAKRRRRMGGPAADAASRAEAWVGDDDEDEEEDAARPPPPVMAEDESDAEDIADTYEAGDDEGESWARGQRQLLRAKASASGRRPDREAEEELVAENNPVRLDKKTGVVTRVVGEEDDPETRVGCAARVAASLRHRSTDHARSTTSQASPSRPSTSRQK